jgi:hypothetical protein
LQLFALIFMQTKNIVPLPPLIRFKSEYEAGIINNQGKKCTGYIRP